MYGRIIIRPYVYRPNLFFSSLEINLFIYLSLFFTSILSQYVNELVLHTLLETSRFSKGLQR